MKQQRECLKIYFSTNYWMFLFLLLFPPAWAVYFNVVKIQLGGHILLECYKKALHDSNHMNSWNGICDAPLSHCVYTEDGVIGKHIFIQNGFFLFLFIATQHNNGFLCNLCCTIQKWNEKATVAVGRTSQRHSAASPSTHEQTASFSRVLQTYRVTSGRLQKG